MYIHPAVVRMTGRIPELGRVLLAALLLLIIAADTIVTVRGLLIMKGKLDDLTARMAELRLKTEEGREKLRLAFAERADALKEDIDGRAEAWRELFTARWRLWRQTTTSIRTS